MVRRLAPWALTLGLGGCIDVPALSFRPLADAAAPDASADVAPRPDASQDARPNAGDAAPRPDLAADARPDAPDRGADSAMPGDAGPAMDALKPGPDAPLTADAAPIGPDAAGPPPLPDAVVVPVPDAAIPPPLADAAVPPPSPDAAVPPPLPDAAPNVADAAPPVPDAAPPVPDAAPPVPDAAPPVPDAAPPLPDAAVPPPIVVVPRIVPGPAVGRRFGAALALVPDQNGDGFADVVVGAPRSAGGGGAQTSALHLIDGVTGAEISRHLERNETDDFGASLVAGPFAENVAGWQVIVGAATANNNRGMLFAHELPGLGQVDSLSAQEQNARLGSTLAVAHDNNLILALSSMPGVVISPRVAFNRLRYNGPGAWSLDRHARLNPNLVAAGAFGANLIGVPPAREGELDDFVAVMDGILPGTRRVVRYRNGSPALLRSEYLPQSPDTTTGTSLLEIPFAPAMLAVGTPGDGRGVVSIFVREAGEREAPLLEMTPLDAAEGFGTSAALAPLLNSPDVAAPVLCIGAPGRAPAVPGMVECRGIGGEQNVITLVAPAETLAFGRTLAVAGARDPDGTWLIVVGAPDSTGPNGVQGGLVLHRVTSPP